MNNWAYHPNKTVTLLDGFNLDIAIIDKDLNTTSIVSNSNNSKNNTGVDVFFIHPTVLQNLASYTTITNVPIANQNATFVELSIRGQAGLLAKYGRIFAPRYRQATPLTFINSPLDLNQANVLGVAYSDIKAAFLDYLNNFNNGNKIIIASHSQGAYLAGFLLKDIFDSNPQVREKLVVSVIAGISSNYAAPNTYLGGWWQNIPFCTQIAECGCVMNWKSYKEGQTPPIPNNSHPSLNPIIASNGWIYSPLNLSQNWIIQDSLYYDNQVRPLRNFITLRSNVTFGGNVGYVAFDSLYSIRYQRFSRNQIGFMLQHTPQPNDQRPDLLINEESNPLFSTLGYHQKDYNIYTWAMLEQINAKLNNCGATIGVSVSLLDKQSTIYPNPANNYIKIKSKNENLESEVLEIFDTAGKIVFSDRLDQNGGVEIGELKQGLYFVKVKFGIYKLLIEN